MARRARLADGVPRYLAESERIFWWVVLSAWGGDPSTSKFRGDTTRGKLFGNHATEAEGRVPDAPESRMTWAPDTVAVLFTYAPSPTNVSDSPEPSP